MVCLAMHPCLRKIDRLSQMLISSQWGQNALLYSNLKEITPWAICNPVQFKGPTRTHHQTDCALIIQGFLARLLNGMQYLFMRYYVMSDSFSDERALTHSYGFDVDGSWLARSKAAAVLVGGDWALEYPFPVPPKVHVSFS